MNPLVETSRIDKAARGCKVRGLEILEAETCIKRAIDQFSERLCVACSSGSCSVVALHMTLQFKPDVLVIFNNTGVECPETLAYKKRLAQEWRLNLLETKPVKPFWQCVREYGFPLFRGKRGKNEGNSGKPACCRFLKELPLKKAVEHFGIRAEITGMRAAESRARMFAFSQLGQNYTAHKYVTITKINPLAFWTHKQVWDYLREHKIPTNPIYEVVPRSGCMSCTGFLG